MIRSLSLCVYCCLWAMNSCALQQVASPSKVADQTAKPTTTERSGVAAEWTKIDVPLLKSGDLITFGSNGTVVAAGRGTLLLSLDGGQTWRPVKGGNGSQLYTNDGGKTFHYERLQNNSSLSSPIKISDLCSVESAAFTPSGRLYLSTTCDHSTALWSIPIGKLSDPWHVRRFAASAEQYESKNSSYYGPGRNLITIGEKVLTDANLPAGSCLLTATDLGMTWDQVWCDPNTVPVVVFDFVDDKQGWMLRANGQLSRTEDGGHTWLVISTLPPVAAGHVLSLDFISLTTGFVAGENGLILSTKDGGRNWKLQTSNTKNSLYKVAAANANKAWAVGEKGTVLETKDGGSSWLKAELNIVEDVTNLTVSDGHAWFVVGNQIYRTS